MERRPGKPSGGYTAHSKLQSHRDIDLSDNDNQSHTYGNQQDWRIVDCQVAKIGDGEEAGCSNCRNHEQRQEAMAAAISRLYRLMTGQFYPRPFDLARLKTRA